VYTPLAGTVVTGNDTLEQTPEAVNADPYGAGWLVQLTPADTAALDSLMSASDYQAFVEAE
jgi:glycine cleavage system H protein